MQKVQYLNVADESKDTAAAFESVEILRRCNARRFSQIQSDQAYKSKMEYEQTLARSREL